MHLPNSESELARTAKANIINEMIHFKSPIFISAKNKSTSSEYSKHTYIDNMLYHYQKYHPKLCTAAIIQLYIPGKKTANSLSIPPFKHHLAGSEQIGHVISQPWGIEYLH